MVCTECGEEHTEEELLREHAHHCPDWDYLLIDVSCDEANLCNCIFKPFSNTIVGRRVK